MKKLETYELKILLEAFIYCDCIRDPESFEFLVDRLRDRYRGIKIKSIRSYKQCLLEIINQYQKYDQLLLYFINEMDILYEEGSFHIKELQKTYDKLFSPPPPDDARVKIRGSDWIIRIDQSNTGDITIPSLFSDISDDMIEKAMKPLRTWKKIHTSCEVLARNYIDVYKYIVKEDTEIAIKVRFV